MFIKDSDILKLKSAYCLMSLSSTEENNIPKELALLLLDLNLKDLSTFNLSDSDIKEIDDMILDELKMLNDIENITNMKHIPRVQATLDF